MVNFNEQDWSLQMSGVTASLAAPVYEPSTTWSAGNGCYYPNCTAAHNAKEGNIPKGDPHYCEAQDRDGDGIACEW